MASSLRKYAFLNAKLRTRISQILPREMLERILHSGSMPEAVHLLASSPYGFAAEVYDQTGDIRMVELALFSREIGLYRELSPYLDTELQRFVTALVLSYEIEVLKRAIRMWFHRVVRSRTVDDTTGYLYRDRIVHTLNVDTLVNAADTKQLLEALDGTPYADVIRRSNTGGLPETGAPSSLYQWEVALDRYYYTSLTAQIERLHGRDREIARKMIGVEIDRQNISWMIRLKTTFDLPVEEALASMIGGGSAVDGAVVKDAYQARNPGDMLAALLRRGPLTSMVAAAGSSASQLVLIDEILREIVFQEVHRILLGYPFTIGIMLAYFVLKRNEIRAVAMILNAKSLGIGADALRSLL